VTYDDQQSPRSQNLNLEYDRGAAGSVEDDDDELMTDEQTRLT
jgi:hypothetical protein